MVTDHGDFLPFDLLGRQLGQATDLETAEERLETQGLKHLARPWWIDIDDGRRVKVTIQETSPTVVVVRVDDFGALDVYGTEYELPVPTDRLSDTP